MQRVSQKIVVFLPWETIETEAQQQILNTAEDPATWGCARVSGADELAARYVTLLETIHALGIFAGFCYTQFADKYQEANGLLTAERRPKFPIADMFAATTGATAPVSDSAASTDAPRQLPPSDAEGSS